LRDELQRQGAMVSMSDPHYSDDELRAAGFEPAVDDAAQAIVLNTAHREFASPDFAAWRAQGIEAVLDGRNFWSQAEVESAGLLYLGVGRSARGEPR
jgi:UDP-N-acetyl-D-mannosaminuronate dehydrogenase